MASTSFPLQAAFLLDEPGRDFEGGEFVLVEQRPRQQSAPQVVPLGQGEGVIFAVRERPARERAASIGGCCGTGSARSGRDGGGRWG
jgi:hypothetical protein